MSKTTKKKLVNRGASSIISGASPVLISKQKKKMAGDNSSDRFKKVSRVIAQKEMDLLCQQYPEAECELDFENSFQLLTAVILSAQTTDANVNKVTKAPVQTISQCQIIGRS